MMPWPVFLALIALDIGTLVAAVALTKRWPHHHSLMGLLLGVGIVATVLVTLDQLVVVARSQRATEVRLFFIFGVALCLQVWLYRRRARASFRNAVWDPVQRRWRPALPFTAALAPVGVLSNDGRPGLMATEWSVRGGGAPVTIADPGHPLEPLVVGRLDQVWLGPSIPRMLYGAGVILPGVDLTDRRPAVEIQPGGLPAAPHPDMPAMFPTGQILAVRLHNRPAFNGVWLRYVEGRMP